MPLQSSNLKYQAFLLAIGLYWTYSYWITLIPTLFYLFWIGQKLLRSPKVKGLNDFDLIVFQLSAVMSQIIQNWLKNNIL